MLIAGWPSLARHERMRPDAGRFYSSAGNAATALLGHLDEQSDGQADDVEEASLDVRHQCRPRLLDCVPARTAAPFAAGYVLVDVRPVEWPEAHCRAGVPGVLA